MYITTIIGTAISLIGGYMMALPSFKRIYTDGGGEGVDIGKLRLDGGRPDPDIEIKEQRLSRIGFYLVILGALVNLLGLLPNPES